MLDKFEFYLKSGKVKRKTTDIVEADSLLKKANLRINNMRKLNEKTASLFLEDAYEAAREAAQSLMSLKGFKQYSHEATISFIIQYYKKEFSEYEIAQFDRFRELRNNSVYKAEQVSIEDSLKCLEFAKSLINKIGKLSEKKN